MKLLKNTSKYGLLALTLVLNTTAHSSIKVADEIDTWLDLKLESKKTDVKVLLYSQKPTPVPTQGYGYSFPVFNSFDLKCLQEVRQRSGEKRASVLDLGCGLGGMSTYMVLAGGRVDAVDFKETVTEANKSIYTTTRKVIGYKPADAGTYYSAYPGNIVDQKKPAWATKPHVVAHCSNVVHFLNESELKRLSTRVFDTLENGGVFMIQTDTPFYHQSWVDFYNERRKERAACPGYAIYSKRGQQLGASANIVEVVGEPVACKPSFGRKPGERYTGWFQLEKKKKQKKKGKSNGKEFKVTPGNYYHTVKNLFMVEDLAKLMTSAAKFEIAEMFYMDEAGKPLMKGGLMEYDLTPKVGGHTKACLILKKPE